MVRTHMGLELTNEEIDYISEYGEAAYQEAEEHRNEEQGEVDIERHEYAGETFYWRLG